MLKFFFIHHTFTFIMANLRNRFTRIKHTHYPRARNARIYINLSLRVSSLIPANYNVNIINYYFRANPSWESKKKKQQRLSVF